MIRGNRGFTLLELLVVVAITGILAAIAIYQYANYKEQAYCSRIETDVHNTVTTLEGQYANTQSYAGVQPIQTEDNGIVISIDASATQISSVQGEHPRCPRGKFTFDPTATPTYSWQ